MIMIFLDGGRLELYRVSGGCWRLQGRLLEDKHTKASGWMERKAMLREVKRDVSFVVEHQEGSSCLLYVKHQQALSSSLRN
jgi:hypothetical protein